MLNVEWGRVERVVEAGIAEGVFPGAAFGVWHRGKTRLSARGRFTYCPDSPAVEVDSIWDLASVSKVVGTTSLAMQLAAEGKLELEAPVCRVLDEFRGHGKEAITFRNLLVHDAGLIAFRPFHTLLNPLPIDSLPDRVWTAICAEKLQQPIGSKMVYSDLNMIVLQRALERLSGTSLDRGLKERVFGPLGMDHTGYSPAELGWRLQCVPTETTEDWRRQLRRARLGDMGARDQFGADPEFIQGEVHDPTATVLGGVAGHAGLFSTLPDLLRYLPDLTDGKAAPTELVREWTRQQSPASSRALGWDTKSPTGSSAGTRFGPRSFGHTGYTGTSVWVDPDADLIAVLLSNRVHPSASNTKIQQFRPRFHNAVVEALAVG